MHHLSVDLETYSSVPIAKAGAQKYIASPDFEILLFAYSLDNAPVVCVDFARGELLPAANSGGTFFPKLHKTCV